ncbi:Ig-like domain-containing protein [Acinetobacter sp. CE-15]|uniref:Ig-like domain-containing protein n=1 Tax=Acinetobacter sp. CE-15 TaxID=3425693 RepID=UPI003DA57CC9
MLLSKMKIGHKTLIASSICTILAGCGGGGSSGGGDSKPSNTAPTIDAISPLTIQTLDSKKISVTAKDAENNALTYSIKTAPKLGTASIDSKTGVITYIAGNVVGADTLVVSVSDGSLSTDLSITINTQVESVFDYQFYKVANPETGNSQIVRYDPNNGKQEYYSSISNVILGNRVFVMSAAKDGDKTVYKKREYAIFLDPNASKETRNYTPAGATTATEYTFYTDNILKRFDASNPNSQATIFSSAALPAALTAAGMKVIGDTQTMYLNETDIDNSYVQLRTFAKLPDIFRGELSDNIKNAYITVRLSDGKVTQGRTIKQVVNNTTGKTDSVLVNYSAAYVKGSYPTASNEAARLQSCTVDLVTCTDIGGGTGQYYFLAQNDSHIYLAKEGVKTLYAYDKTAKTLANVTGAEYPANYNPEHHQLKFGGGHGGAGIFSNFFNMPNVVDNLAEGNTGYLLINYNLDTQNAAITHTIFGNAYVFKNAEILKLTGTSASKIYDNGTGTDLANNSSNVALSYNLNLTAVKNGYLFVEAAKLSKDKMNLNYQQGWLNTATTTTKTALDNAVIDQDIPYFTSMRVPAVAVGDYVYVNETNPTAAATRVYNVYKLPLNAPTASKTSVTPTIGRMYFERTAFRANGVYEGNVLLWNKRANQATDTDDTVGSIVNATTGKLMGNIKDLEGGGGITNVTADASGNATLAGIGGLFGLHMTGTHTGVPLLTSGFSENEKSLKRVNQINGSWITD